MGLEIAEIILDLEDHFDIRIPGGAGIATLGDLSDAISEQLAKRGKPDPGVWVYLEDYLIDRWSLKPWQVTRQARIIQDLGFG